MKARVHRLCCSDSKVKFAELTNGGSSDLFSLQARVRADRAEPEMERAADLPVPTSHLSQAKRRKRLG